MAERERRLAGMHAEHQQQAATEAARLLRTLDDGVREAVLRHWRHADLPGSGGCIRAAVADYTLRLLRAMGELPPEPSARDKARQCERLFCEVCGKSLCTCREEVPTPQGWESI